MDRTHADDDRPAPMDSALSRDDARRALDHKLDRLAPSRRAVWPKDDRRSSERVAPPGAGHPGRRSSDRPRGDAELPMQ